MTVDAVCQLCRRPLTHHSLDTADICNMPLPAEPIVSTFGRFCDDLSVTPEERDQLALHLASLRAAKTYAALRRQVHF